MNDKCKNKLISSFSCSGDTPGIWFFVLVEQGFDPLSLLEFGQFGGIRKSVNIIF